MHRARLPYERQPHSKLPSCERAEHEPSSFHGSYAIHALVAKAVNERRSGGGEHLRIAEDGSEVGMTARPSEPIKEQPSSMR